VVSCTGTVANGQNVDTSSVGTKTFTVTSRDADDNVTTATVEYQVGTTFRRRLEVLRDQTVALPLTGQADVRRDNAVAFFNNALLDRAWDPQERPATDSNGMNALRQMRQGYLYLRSPNETLSGASAGIQAGLVELIGDIALSRYAEVVAIPGASQSRLNQAKINLDLAAGNPGGAEAFIQYLKAWETLREEQPQYGP
jgi:hypothetical protein